MPRRNPLVSFEREMIDLGQVLSDADLIIDRNYPRRFGIGGNETVLAWNTYLSSGGADFATVEEYTQFLRKRQYTYLLLDGSLIQLLYRFKSRTVIGHRLGYYPSPVAIARAEFVECLEQGLTLVDLVNDKLWQDTLASSLRLRSPIRFDFDVEDNRENHPASHLHMSQGDCRIAVYAPLSIGHFMSFVFRHFYPEQWDGNESVRQWPQSVLDKTILPQHEQLLHLACAR